MHIAESVAHAIALARTHGADAKFIAGGTDLIIQINRGRQQPRHVIDISRLGLAGIETGPGLCSIGALTTLKTIQNHAFINTKLTALAEAARVVGGHQVRNIATIGGNIANASPAADVVVALLALDAEVELAGATDTRRQALDQLLTGPGQTTCAADEIISTIRITPDNRSASSFLKAGRRKAMEISVVCVAASLAVEGPDQVCTSARIALGAVAPRAIRARTAEAHLIGQPLTQDRMQQAGEIAAGECRPLSDVRASETYRRLLVSALVPRALAQSAARIAEAAP